MGCVLGTRAAGERAGPRRSKIGERRNSETVTVTVVNGAVERGKEKEIDDAVSTATSATPEFRLRRGVRAGGEVWPSWLIDVAGHAIEDWEPRRANTFEKLDKIGQGTYSNVYKAKDLITGKLVALKKVRFDNLEPEAVKFMAREILILRKLDHPNVIKLEGIAISRMSSSLYLVFEYMEHDLAGLSSLQSVKFTEPQIKCYMKQLLSGLEHCHNNGVLHRDIKTSNLLIDNQGILRIADFGLASFFDPQCKRPMTSRVVTLWYRPPELLLGATHYSVGIDLWSAGCILAELFAGKPILRGRTEVEQLHKTFKLCGSPSEAYWKKSKFPNANIYKPQQPYKRCVADAFKEFPPSALALVETLLSVLPDARGTTTAALNSEFFTTEPYACEPSSLPTFPPSKELDIKLRDEQARRRQQGGSSTKPHAADGNRRARARSRAIPAPEANAELQPNLDRLRIRSDAKPKSKSEKFPPPHQDGAVGHQNGAVSFGAVDNTSFSSSGAVDNTSCSSSIIDSSAASRSKNEKEESRRGPSRRFINALYPSSVGWDFGFSRRRTVSNNFKDPR